MRQGHQVGDCVFVRDAAFAWLPATIVACETDRVQVQIELPSNWESTTQGAATSSSNKDKDKDQQQQWVDLNDYRDRLLPMQNTITTNDGTTTITSTSTRTSTVQSKLSSSSSSSTRDMADLPHLHEAAILYQIKERHGQERPYTRVGEIVVAVNPCRWIKDLYSVHQGILYAKNFVWQRK